MMTLLIIWSGWTTFVKEVFQFELLQQQFWDWLVLALPRRGKGLNFFHLIFSIFDDGSFHIEPSPHLIRHFPHLIRNIKVNKFLWLFNAWVSSVYWFPPCRSELWTVQWVNKSYDFIWRSLEKYFPTMLLYFLQSAINIFQCYQLR